MDIELLSKMVADLIIDHDTVGLPGLGSFSAELVPASFTDRGYTINPPYRRLVFCSGHPSDMLLADYYANTNSIDKEEARIIIADYIAQMKAVLKERKTIIFPNLGKLRATRDNTFFFVCDENLDIFPEGIAMEPISLKTRSISEEELAHAVSSISEMIAAVRPEPETETVIAADAPNAESLIAAAEEPKAEAATATAEPEVESATATAEQEVETAPSAEESERSIDAEREKPSAEQESINTESAAPELVNTETANATQKRRQIRWWIVPLTLAATAAAIIAGFVILSRVAPEFTDSLLYTPEELRIINY